MSNELTIEEILKGYFQDFIFNDFKVIIRLNVNEDAEPLKIIDTLSTSLKENTQGVIVIYADLVDSKSFIKGVSVLNKYNIVLYTKNNIFHEDILNLLEKKDYIYPDNHSKVFYGHSYSYPKITTNYNVLKGLEGLIGFRFNIEVILRRQHNINRVPVDTINIQQN